MDDRADKEGDRQSKDEGEPYNSIQGIFANAGNVFSTIWLRCIVQTYNGYERIVLGGGWRFLLNFRILLVLLYISYEIFK